MEIIKHGNKLKTFICDECDCEWKLSPMDIKKENYYAVLRDEWDNNNFEKRHEYYCAVKCPECGHIKIQCEQTIWYKCDDMSEIHHEWNINTDKLRQYNLELPIDF